MTIEEKKSTELDNIIARVKKLQSLAGNNTSQEEVLAATKIAERLIQQHRLTEAQLQAEQVMPQEAIIDDTVIVFGRRLAYANELLDGLCEHFNGSYYMRIRSGETQYFLIAKESDWKIIHYFLNFLMFETDRLARRACKGQGLAMSNSFRMGVALGVNSLWKEAREATRADTNNSTALVHLSNRAKEVEMEKRKRHPDLVSASHISGGTRHDGRSAGFAAGRSISLNRGQEADEYVPVTTALYEDGTSEIALLP